MKRDSSATRRQWIGKCACTVGAISIAGCSDRTDTEGGAENDGSTTSSPEWPMYGVDRQNTAHHPEVSGPDGPEVTAREVVDTGETGLYPVTIADGMLYGNAAGQSIYAVDLETEELEWRGDVGGSTVVHDGRVYGPISGETLYAFDVDDGDLWESERNDAVSAFVTHPLPTADGLLTTSRDALWRYDYDTGEPTKLLDLPTTRMTTEWPAYKDGTLYIGRTEGVSAIDVEAREIEWTFEPESGGSVAFSNPAVTDSMAYVIDSEDLLHGVNVNSGTAEWTAEIESSTDKSPAVADGRVYLTDSRYVMALDAATGDIEWEAGGEIILEPEDPIIVDGICYVTTSFQTIGYDVRSGETVWKYERPDDSEIRFSAPPTVFDGTAYVPSSDDTLYGIEDT